MLTISQQQSLDRWDAITPRLREALFSENNADFVSKVCGDEHLSEEKGAQVAGISGYVLLGFIHPGDLAGELKDGIGLDPKTASSIASAINQRIFTPLRIDIDKVYSPLSKFEAAPQAPIPSAPKIISESFVAKPNATATGAMPAAAPKPAAPPQAPQPKPQVISQTVAGLNLNASPLASNRNAAAPAPQPTKPDLNKQGWSRQTAQEPVVRLGAISPGIPTPAAGATPASPIPPAQGAPSNQPKLPQKNISEFDRLDRMKQNAAAPSMPAPSSSAPKPVPPPVMLHEVPTNAPPIQKSPDLRFGMGLQNQMSAKPSQMPLPPKAAVIEFGPSAKPPQMGAPVPTPPRPSAPQPPKPQPPTQLPASPAPGKIIVKDFLEPPQQQQK